MKCGYQGFFGDLARRVSHLFSVTLLSILTLSGCLYLSTPIHVLNEIIL